LRSSSRKLDLDDHLEKLPEFVARRTERRPGVNLDNNYLEDNIADGIISDSISSNHSRLQGQWKGHVAEQRTYILPLAITVLTEDMRISVTRI
jgi:hypothetical protein